MAQKRGRPSLPNKAELMEEVVRFRLEGESFRGIALKLTIDTETVHRLIDGQKFFKPRHVYAP